jgi:hypothetical protein
VLVVDLLGGPGADHTTVQAAIDAALPGDLVLVRGGDYPERPHISGKGLALVGDAGAVVRVLGLDVTDVPAGQSVLVRGLAPRVEGLLSILGGRAAEVARVDGPIWFDDCSLDSAPIPAFYGVSGGLRVEDSASVVLTRSRIARPFPSVSVPSLSALEFLGGQSLYVLASEVNGMHTRAALSVASAELELTGTSVFGQDGSDCFHSGCCTPGSDALELLPGSVATIRDTVLQAGSGGDPGCADGLPLDLAGGAATTVPGASAWLEIDGPQREGELVSVSIHATPGSRVWLRHAAAPAAGGSSPNVDGKLLLAAPVTTLPVGIVPASGVLLVQAPAPALAGDEVRLFWLQALVRGVGRFHASAPATLVVLAAGT